MSSKSSESHGGGFRKWQHPYKVGQLVRWKFYDYDKVMLITSLTPNSIVMRAYDNPEFLVIEYEDAIDKYITGITQ